jgi:hypothetical protein
MNEIRAHVDKITKALTGEGYSADLAAARKEYFAETGESFEEDRSFEMRMVTFLEWFIFDRPLASGVVPIRAYLDAHASQLSPEEQALTEALLHQRHGLYRVKKVKPPVLGLKDLWNGKPVRVEAGEMALAFHEGDLLDARLVTYQGKTRLTEGILCHPVEAEPFIKAQLKALRKAGAPGPDTLFLPLAAMLLKHERYRHIKAEHIYKKA